MEIVVGDKMKEITFKVRSLDSKRDLALVSLSDGHMLRKLNDIIQEALRWNNDHLFEFIMKGKPYDPSCRSYQCECEDCDTDDPAFLGFAEKTKIGSVGLTPKQKFVYHFDYGDEHFFEIEVDEIIQTTKKSKPTVLKRYGKMPKQYE